MPHWKDNSNQRFATGTVSAAPAPAVALVPQQPPVTVPPASGDSILNVIEARAAVLRMEIAKLEGMRTELGMLEAMLAAAKRKEPE